MDINEQVSQCTNWTAIMLRAVSEVRVRKKKNHSLKQHAIDEAAWEESQRAPSRRHNITIPHPSCRMCFPPSSLSFPVNSAKLDGRLCIACSFMTRGVTQRVTSQLRRQRGDTVKITCQYSTGGLVCVISQFHKHVSIDWVCIPVFTRASVSDVCAGSVPWA